MTDPESSATDPSTQILDWSSELPSWQRDALRRLFLDGEISTSGLHDLELILRKEHGLLDSEEAPEALPLTSDHLLPSSEPGTEVRILALHSVKNSMRLKPMEIIEIGPVGLTMIYGDNGCGKSGYAKIIKRSAGARGAEIVRANIFDPKFSEAPAASAVFKIAKTIELQTDLVDLTWVESAGKSALAELNSLLIFDRGCAAIYVNEQHEVAFAPTALEHLSRLIETCDQLAETCDRARFSGEQEVSEILSSLPGVEGVRNFASSITADSKLSDIQLAAAWDSNTDEEELRRIERVLSDARQEKTIITARVARLGSFRTRYVTIRESLAETFVETISKDRDEVLALSEAADQLAVELRSHSPLGTAGTNTWKILWEAARSYSRTDAYLGKAFPVTEGDDTRCVLCEQILDGNAKQRLQHFEHFVTENVSVRLQAANVRLEKSTSLLLSVKVTQGDEQTLIEEIQDDDQTLANSIGEFLTQAAERKESIIEALATGNFDNLSSEPLSLVGRLDFYLDELRARLLEIERAIDPTKRVELEQKQRQLMVRKGLSSCLPSLARIVEVRQRLRKFEACKNSLRTTRITTKRSSLERTLLHDRLRDELNDELAKLGLERPVTLGFKGDKGTSRQWMRFADSHYSKLDEVLSEGEHRAIALACFFAEANLVPKHVGMVVDDPVSSLDHVRRERVARRFIKEARDGRQVIVFTHDLVFYCEMLSLAREHQLNIRTKTLRQVGSLVGEVAKDGEPWPMKDAKARLALLQNEQLPDLRKMFKERSPNYRDRAREFGEKLRETWERVIEEHVLADVVVRYRPSVETSKLRSVSVDNEMFRAVHWGMTRTSKWAHDESRMKGTPAPSPDELADEIDDIRTFIVGITGRNTEVAKERKELLRGT